MSASPAKRYLSKWPNGRVHPKSPVAPSKPNPACQSSRWAAVLWPGTATVAVAAPPAAPAPAGSRARPPDLRPAAWRRDRGRRRPRSRRHPGRRSRPPRRACGTASRCGRPRPATRRGLPSGPDRSRPRRWRAGRRGPRRPEARLAGSPGRSTRSGPEGVPFRYSDRHERDTCRAARTVRWRPGWRRST